MPGLLRTSRSPVSSSEEDSPSSSRGSSVNGDYPAVSFPNYGEKLLSDQLEPIAVVGMGCRLPGDVGSPADFWDMMINKKTGNTPKVPASRFNIDAHFHKNNDRPGSFGVLGGYFLNDDLADFDPGLFGITPIEAMWMDPQQRKLLEVVYEALESGGISLDAVSGTRTAVFAASFTADWQQMSFKEHSFRHSLAATGVDPGIISNRISHVFNLNGPSIVCNTACSSSVYALHNACNALRNKEAEAAIVGGVNLIITVDQHMNTAKLGVLSPTSTCHTFDESADGYGRADAVGAVYLKRLSDAVRDGDPIRGVIRSSAVNSNGKVPAVGITHPNREGQADVIAHAYKRGGDLDPRLTGYFECHGTGTAIGDPLEVHAVSMAMNRDRKPGEEPLLIGAVKTNIGHSEAASGLSALIKAVLIVERGIIPPTRGIIKLNPKIKWDEWQVKAVTEPVPFPEHLPVKRVSINSFGYGGTNAHVIVEGADSMLRKSQSYKYYDSSKSRLHVPRRTMHRNRPFLLPFSAHDKATLKRNIDAHGRVVDKYNLLDLSHTLANRRSVLSSKAFTVVNHNTLNNVFDTVATSFTFAEKKTTRNVGFVFTGQGAQWARMGAELIEYCPRFLQSIRVLDVALGELSDGPDWSIEDVLLESEKSSRVGNAEFSQPLCTAVQVALVQLLEYWGIRPMVTVGHSSGEIAAAYAAGLISAREAITVAYYRGKVTRDINTDGTMLAVGLGAAAVEPYLASVQGKVVVACHNSPSSVTLSGDTDAVNAVKAKLDAKNIFARIVNTNGKAYHSHHMAPASHRYEKLVRAAKSNSSYDLPTPTTAKMVSSVTSAVIPEMTVLDHTYWSTNLRSPVLFNQAVQEILTSKEFSDLDLLIEIGPHSAMSGPIKQIKAELKSEKPEYLPTLLRGTDSAVQLLNLAGNMFLRNYPMNMGRVTTAYIEEKSFGSKLGQNKGSVIVDLPPYQWNYSRPFWAEARSSREQRLPKFPRHDVLGQVVIGSSLTEPTWRNILRVRDLPWLKDHSLGGEVVFPAAGYFGMAIEAITQLNELSSKPQEIESYFLRDVSIKKALVTPDDDDGIEVIFNMRPSVYSESDSKATWWDFSVSSIAGDEVKEHMAGSISINTRPRGKVPRKAPELPQRASGKSWNEAFREVGFDYGPTFQDMDDIRFDGKHYEASCRTNIKQHLDESLGESRYVLHPAVVDSTLQLSIVAIYAGRSNTMDCGVVPIQVDEVTIWPPTSQQLSDERATAYAWVDKRGIRAFENSVQMTAADGQMVMEIINVRTTSYEAACPQKAEAAIQEAPYGEMSWERDFDTLKTDSDIDGLTVPDLMNLFLFKFPNRKILEVGFGQALEVLQKYPQASYTIVVNSDEEKDLATAAIAEYHNAKVVKLDMEQDLDTKIISPESYDMLLATDKTPSAIKTLFKLRESLKSGGHVVWNSPEAGPALYKAGFGRFDSVLKNSFGSTLAWNTASTQNGEDSVSSKQHSVQLVYRKSPGKISSLIKDSLETIPWNVTISSLNDCIDTIASDNVILLDMEEPLLLNINEGEFSALKTIIKSASSLLWITPGALLSGKMPEYGMVSGLARSITSEQASLDFRILDLDMGTIEPERAVKLIERILSQQVLKDKEESPEREFCFSGGKTYISRLIRNNSLNAIFDPTWKSEPMPVTLKDRITGVIRKGKVVFQQQIPGKDVTAKPGHVEIKVQCTGLTSEGVQVITGVDYPTTFSHEIGGVVNEVGPGVTGFKVGDRVVGFNADKFASHQQIPSSMIQKLDDDEDMTTAVSMLMACAAAIHGLETLARVREAEIVLILNGTGTSGAAAAKVAQFRGAIPYVVAKTEEEVKFLQTYLGLGREQIIRSDKYLVSERIKEFTNGRGANVVFSTGSVNPSDAREAWRSIAHFGRFIDSGRKDVLSRKALDTIPVQRSASYMPFDILQILENHPEVLSFLLKKVLGMFREGLVVSPGVVQPIRLSDLDQAVANFSATFGAAKPVIVYETPEPTIVQTLPARLPLRFNPEATYLLVGCLGGLGRSLTSLMMECGARRFTFLSRSGADSKSAAKLVSDIESAGAVVDVVRGDATSKADVARAVQRVSPDHPVRGVVHAAMVLRDGLFHSMSFENWKTSVEPKVLGAANLHSVLENTPLDFFIMTSSVSGILGTPGQSNYAAANSYLDALARHRRFTGKPATSLILPMVLGVGVVAENSELEESLKRKGMYGIDEAMLLEAFEAAIISQANELVPDHIVIGLDPLRLQKAVSDAGTSDSFWVEDTRFSHVIQDMKSCEDDNTGGAAGSQSILATIQAAESPAEAIAILSEHFIGKLSRMLLLSPDDFDPDARSIADYGIDSMIGAELRNWIFKEYRMDIPFQQLLAASLTITKFSKQVCSTVGILTS